MNRSVSLSSKIAILIFMLAGQIFQLPQGRIVPEQATDIPHEFAAYLPRYLPELEKTELIWERIWYGDDKAFWPAFRFPDRHVAAGSRSLTCGPMA